MIEVIDASFLSMTGQGFNDLGNLVRVEFGSKQPPT